MVGYSIVVLTSKAIAMPTFLPSGNCVPTSETWKVFRRFDALKLCNTLRFNALICRFSDVGKAYSFTQLQRFRVTAQHCSNVPLVDLITKLHPSKHRATLQRCFTVAMPQCHNVTLQRISVGQSDNVRAISFSAVVVKTCYLVSLQHCISATLQPDCIATARHCLSVAMVPSYRESE